jgi:hypothetical protein
MTLKWGSWIKDHKVCFEVVPFCCLHKSKINKIGFELHIYAQHEILHKKDPGSTEAYELYLALEEIARGVIPSNMPNCRCEIAGFDFSFCLRPETQLKEEIQLVVNVVHRENFFDWVDQSEADCITKMQQQLLGMGAKLKVWQAKEMKQELH